jgi:hypothetical protein
LKAATNAVTVKYSRRFTVAIWLIFMTTYVTESISTMPTEHTDYQIVLAASKSRATLLSASLMAQNYRLIDTQTNFEEARLKLTKYDLSQATCILIDIRLPNTKTDKTYMGIGLARHTRAIYGHVGIIIIDDGTSLEEVQYFFSTAQGCGFAYMFNSPVPLQPLDTAIDHIRAGHTVIQDAMTRKLVPRYRNHR